MTIQTLPSADRFPYFWKKCIKRESGCWEWTACKDKAGYGKFSVNGNPRPAHRVAWSIANGQNAIGVICHKCDNTSCVNPEHLWLSDQKENIKDMVLKGRARGANQTHCKNGHEFNEENTYYHGEYKTRRSCRKCNAEVVKRSYDKKKTGNA